MRASHLLSLRDRVVATKPILASPTATYSPALMYQAVMESSVPGSRAARQSGSRLNVVWLSGQYQRAMRVPGGVLRA